MKRILLIHNGYPTKKNPEYCTWVKSIQDCLAGAGFDVILLVRNVDGKSIEKVLSYISYYLKLAFFYKLKEFDFIYVNSPSFSLPILLRVPGKKLLTHWHGSDLIPKTKLKKICLNAAKLLSKDARIVFVPSKYYYSVVQTIIKPKGSVVVSPSGGVDFTFFTSQRMETRKIVIGFASGMTYEKGFDKFLLLADAKNELEKKVKMSVEFIAIDYGDEKGVYKERLSSITVLRKMPKSEMHRFYSRLSILFFGSRREMESLGLVCIEAMASGVPILSNNNAAMPEYVVPGISGELFDIESTSNIFAALNLMLQQLSTYKPQEIAKNYTNQSVVETYRRVLELGNI